MIRWRTDYVENSICRQTVSDRLEKLCQLNELRPYDRKSVCKRVYAVCVIIPYYTHALAHILSISQKNGVHCSNYTIIKMCNEQTEYENAEGTDGRTKERKKSGENGKQATKHTHYGNHLISYAELFRILDGRERISHGDRYHTITDV